jgi:anhydro-N-acetylmuramic acid kinase
LSPEDVQATLATLTAQSITHAIKSSAPDCQQILVCGGGVHNPVLMAQLQNELPQCRIESTSHFGADPDWVEAIAFAWLAQQTMLGLPGNLPSVTGARHPVILGGIYLGAQSFSLNP